MIIRSKIDIMPYITPDKIQSITIAAITRSSLKTCPPYTKRYPKPALLERYSPMITPTQAIPKLIFKVATKFGSVAGKTSLVMIWNLLAPIDFNSIIFSSDTPKYPLSRLIVVITTQIKIPIVTIAFVPIPTQIMINGPKAIFGKLFKTTRYGSNTRLNGVIK